MAEPIVLICELADAPRMVAGSIFDRKCALCGTAVMIAPSGQRILRSGPVQIVCAPCFIAAKVPGNGKPTAVRISPIDELLRELENTQPNQRRHRN
jgi:hypothetical protein